MDSLKEKKASVTRFVREHQQQIDDNKAGTRPLEEGIRLLRDLLDDYLLAILVVSVWSKERSNPSSEAMFFRKG